MLFHISFTIQPEQRDAAQARFLEAGAPPPEGIKMLGRWHGVSGRCGFVLAESADLEPVAKWMHEWTDLLTFKVEPVLNDEQFSRMLGD